MRSIKYTPKLRAKALMECVAFMSMRQRWFGDYGLNQLWSISNDQSEIDRSETACDSCDALVAACVGLFLCRPELVTLEGYRGWEHFNYQHPTINTPMIKEHNERSMCAGDLSNGAPSRTWAFHTVMFTLTHQIR